VKKIHAPGIHFLPQYAMLKQNTGIRLGSVMNFLKRLFGGGGRGSSDALTFYVRPKMCDQIMTIEVNTKDQLSLNDNEDGYVVRKVAKHPRCPFEVEVMLHFDRNKKLTHQEISNGAFVEAQVYFDFLESTQKKSAAN
jgi:hypothetical protein